MRILVIDDNEVFCEFLCSRLEKYGMEAVRVHDGISGFRKSYSENFDVILLGTWLSGMSGIKVLKKLRANCIATPVIMLASENSGDRAIKCLELGADDYVIKPFSADELAARIHAVVRRCGRTEISGFVEFGDVVMNPSVRSLSSEKGEIRMEMREWNVFECLVRNSTNVISCENLARGAGLADSEEIDVCIEYIKRKLELLKSGIKIFKIKGLGYKICVNE